MPEQLDFDEFYLGTRTRVLRQLTAMTVDTERAKDAVQEAYERAWQRWPRVSKLDEPQAWVRTVAWRIAVSQHRRLRVAAAAVPELSVASDRPRDTTDEVLDVRRALRQLSANHRRALVLHEMCGLSVAEVAAETGVSAGTVKSRLSRARHALADVLGPTYLHTLEPARPADERA